MNPRIIAITTCLVAPAAAVGQPIWYSLLSWEASLDNGQTWQGGTVEVGDPSARIKVRGLVAWEYPGAYALAHVAMDVTITYGAGFGDDDLVLDPSRIAPFDSLPAQTYGAMRFGHVIKIDEVRDTLPPGVGPRWVVCGQSPENFNPNFSTSHPAPIFEFELQLDGTEGIRIVDHIYPTTATEGTNGPSVYLTPEGAMTMPRTMYRAPLHLNVIPAPATLTLLLPLLALHRRRRP